MDLYTIRKKLSLGIPLTNIKLRVTNYSRVSTNQDEQKKSLQNQVEHFSKYIKENPNWTYVEGYVDQGITGTSDQKREKFMQMIADAKQNKFDLIITKEISRFSRNTLDSIKYTRELLSDGVAVLFVNDNINTAMPDAELRLTIMASMAQDEIRRLSERVKFGMNRAIERGEILGNDLLYGYKKNKETKMLNMIEKEAQIVRNIYELYAIEKLSLSKIVKKLNQEGIKTCQNKKWCISTISRMIENPKYKGYYCARKTEIVDYMTKKIKYFEKDDWIMYEDKKRIPPIVSEELWDLANDRLTKRKKTDNKAKTKNRYLFSAKIYCEEHQTTFHRREFRKQKKDVTWVCKEYLTHGKIRCDSPNIRESELENIFIDFIKKLQINYQKIVELLINFYKGLEINDNIEEKINNYEKEINILNIKKDKILELNIQEKLTNDEFYEKNNLYNTQIKEWIEKIKKIKSEKQKENSKDKLKKLENVLTSKIKSKSTLNKTIHLLLDHITVSKINNNKNNLNLNIYLSVKEKKKTKKKEPFFKQHLEFKRGYDTKGTKRYQISYQINYFLST